MEMSFGVCRLSVISVRAEQSRQSLQVTQLLFGDHYEVMDESKDRQWLYIRIYYDNSMGWIERKQHHAITKEYYEQINMADFKITTDVCSTILYKKVPLSILMGSIVPISQSELFKMDEQFAFNGESKAVGQKREFEFLKTIALRYLNAPEQEGGKTPFGIDSSGFTQIVFKICGYKLAPQQQDVLRHTKQVNGLSTSKPGDILFYRTWEKSKVEMGILLEENRIVYVDGRVKINHVSEDGILDLDTKIFTHEVISIARILND